MKCLLLCLTLGLIATCRAEISQNDANEKIKNLLIDLWMEQKDTIDPMDVDDKSYRIEWDIFLAGKFVAEMLFANTKIIGASELRLKSDTIVSSVNGVDSITSIVAFKNLQFTTELRLQLNGIGYGFKIKGSVGTAYGALKITLGEGGNTFNSFDIMEFKNIKINDSIFDKIFFLKNRILDFILGKVPLHLRDFAEKGVSAAFKAQVPESS